MTMKDQPETVVPRRPDRKEVARVGDIVVEKDEALVEEVLAAKRGERA